MYVLVGTAPNVDTAVTVGPFRSLERATEAQRDFEHKGFVVEVCPLLKLDEVEMLQDWA